MKKISKIIDVEFLHINSVRELRGSVVKFEFDRKTYLQNTYLSYNPFIKWLIRHKILYMRTEFNMIASVLSIFLSFKATKLDKEIFIHAIGYKNKI